MSTKPVGISSSQLQIHCFSPILRYTLPSQQNKSQHYKPLSIITNIPHNSPFTTYRSSFFAGRIKLKYAIINLQKVLFASWFIIDG
jgi:hypothetical protein